MRSGLVGRVSLAGGISVTAAMMGVVSTVSAQVVAAPLHVSSPVVARATSSGMNAVLQPARIVPVRVPAPNVKVLAPQLAPGPHGLREFPALGNCGTAYCWTPGEPVVAVGPTDILETENTEAAVYSKATFAQLTVFHFESFWTGGTSEQCVDPRAIYLPGDNRFAMSCTDPPANVTRFAISATADPTGAWYKYSVGPPWNDQDKIVATSDKFIVAGNNAGTVEDMYVYNKSDVLAGVPNPTVVHLTTNHSNLYQAAVEQTYTSNAYFVATYQGCGCDEWLATVTGTPAAGNVTLTETALGPTSGAAPQDPSVPGGSIGAGDLDGRVYDAVYETETSDNKPVIQYSTADECGSPRVCVVSARIDLSGPTPVRIYEQSLGQPGWDYTYGAVGLNAAGRVFEAYSRSNGSNAPGAAVLGPGFDLTLQPATTGASSCSSTQNPPCDERWGDYLGVAIDPSDPMSVWVTGLVQLTHGPFGDSGAEAWTTIIAKVSVPAAPTGVTATPGNGQATVKWTAPSTNHGSAISGYVVTPYLGGTAQAPRVFNSTATTETLTGLTNGKTYTFKVAAKNAVGTGPQSTASAPIVVGAPVAPVVTAVGSSGQAALSWNAPANNGSAVTTYVVRTYLGSVLQSTKTHTLTCTPQPCNPARSWTVTGLTNGSLYTFKVVAVNARGAGPAGATTIKVGTPTLPAVPTSVHASAGAGSATVSWVAPANGSATITAYVITPYNAGVAQATITVAGTVTSRLITGLTAGQSYTFKIAARSVVGTGTQSAASNAITPT